MIFLISFQKLNALAMWAHETISNEQLVLSRLSAFAFSHGLGQSRRFDRGPAPFRSTPINGHRQTALHVGLVPEGDTAGFRLL
jgi:hypothetical protein